MKLLAHKKRRVIRGSIRLVFFGLLVLNAEIEAREFSELKQTLPGRIMGVSADDLDGDGRKEMLVSLNVNQDNQNERWLHVYGWSEKMVSKGLLLSDVWKVHPDAVFWDVGKAGDGSGKKSFYFLSSDGLWELEADSSGALQPLLRIEAPIFVASGQEDDFQSLDFIRDWDGDGNEEAFLPLTREALFFKQTGKGAWKQSDAVKINLFSAYNNNVMNGVKLGAFQYLSILFYPLLIPADLNNDGRMDLLALRSGKGYCFLRGKDGKLRKDPDPWDIDIRSRKERIRRQAGLSYQVADLNQDGFADVVVHKVGGNFADLNAETAIFLGRAKRPRAPDPDYHFFSRGLLSGISFQDLDGDNHADMILWTVKAGLWPFLEILLRRIVRVEMNYYYSTWPQGFSDKPQYSRQLSLALDMERPNYLKGLIPNHDGDFNADGLSDLIDAKGEDTLGIFLGKARKGFDGSPWATIPASGIDHVTSLDLDNDGRCDLYGYRIDENNSVLHLWLQVPDE